MTKSERYMLEIIFAWVIGQVICAWATMFTGCTLAQRHDVEDAFEPARFAWTTTQGSK